MSTEQYAVAHEGHIAEEGILSHRVEHRQNMLLLRLAGQKLRFGVFQLGTFVVIVNIVVEDIVRLALFLAPLLLGISGRGPKSRCQVLPHIHVSAFLSVDSTREGDIFEDCHSEKLALLSAAAAVIIL
jgi:hypothetical protein